MKRKLMKLIIICSMTILLGAGPAFAGGRNYHSQHYGAPHYRGYQQNHHGWGYNHQRHYYNHGPRYYRPYYQHHYYGPPPSCYPYNGYYPGYWGPSYNSYYFSGGISEPGFGFVFGTSGNW